MFTAAVSFKLLILVRFVLFLSEISVVYCFDVLMHGAYSFLQVLNC